MITASVRRTLLLTLAAGALAACGDDRPAPTAASDVSPALQARLAAEQARIDSTARALGGPAAVASNSLVGGLLGTTTSLVTGVVNGITYTLLSCDVLPYSASTRIIGPSGGVVSAGRNTLVIPPRALSVPTVITAEAPSGTSAQVRFSPHGLQFAVPAALTMSYGHCLQPSGYVRSIVYTNAKGAIVEAPPSADASRYDRVTGSIDHFSGYVVAHTRASSDY